MKTSLNPTYAVESYNKHNDAVKVNNILGLGLMAVTPWIAGAAPMLEAQEL